MNVKTNILGNALGLLQSSHVVLSSLEVQQVAPETGSGTLIFRVISYNIVGQTIMTFKALFSIGNHIHVCSLF